MVENTGQIAANTESMVKTNLQTYNLIQKITGDSGPLSPPGSPDFEPLDWRVLYRAFKSRELDVIPVKYVSDKMGGPKYLPLKEVFFELDATMRSGGDATRALMPSMATQRQDSPLRLEALGPHIWTYLQEKKIATAAPGRSIADKKTQKAATVLAELPDINGIRAGDVLEKGRFQDICRHLCKKLETDMDSAVLLLHALIRESMPKTPVLNLLQSPCSAIIRGDAGMGKTTLVRKLAIDLFEHLESGEDSDSPLPLFVRLDQVAEHLSVSDPTDQARQHLLSYIHSHWQDRLASPQLTPSAMENYAGDLQIILDGLDEIPSPGLRKKLVETANALAADPRRHVIITSRPAALEPIWLRDSDFPVLELSELEGGQVGAFADKFYRHYTGDRQQGKAAAREFMARLDETEAAQTFAGNPLYLTVMMLMQRLHKVLPRRRLDLYKAFLNMLLLQRAKTATAGRHADKPVFEFMLAGRAPIRWSEDDYIPLLQQMAYNTHNNEEDSVSITPRCVIDSIHACFPHIGLNRPGLEKLAGCFLDWTDERLGLLVFRGGYRGFSHRAIQEYLAALCLADFDEKKEIIDFWENKAYSDPDLWRDVTRLLFCHIRQKRFLFDYLKTRWCRDIASAEDPRVIALIAATYDDLQAFYARQGSSIDPLRDALVDALTRRRDQTL